MSKSPKRVIICGLYWSGSSAAFDLLKEYKEEVVPVSGGALDFEPEGGLRLIGEFEMFRSPGMIADALLGNDEYFRRGEAQANIKNQILSFRFKTMMFLRKVRKVSDFKTALAVSKQVIRTKTSLIQLLDRMEKMPSLSDRMKASQEWLELVEEIVGAKGKKAIILDQAIHLGQHFDVWPEFFGDFKIIIVYRDPRDMLVEQEKYKWLYRKQVSSNDICLYGESLEDIVRFRTDTMRARMNHMDDIKSKVPSDKLLVLKFEDLVQDYDHIKPKIESFIGLDPSDHIEPKKYFDPAKSAKNIGVYKNSKLEIPSDTLADLMDWYHKQ